MMSTVFVCGNLTQVLALQFSQDILVLLLQWSSPMMVACSTGVMLFCFLGFFVDFSQAKLLGFKKLVHCEYT